MMERIYLCIMGREEEGFYIKGRENYFKKKL